jgi:hypothetical protein
MSSDREQWTDAEWVDQCHARNPQALAWVAELFMEELYDAVAAWGSWDGRTQSEDVWDALQDLFTLLLENPEKLFRSFDPGRMALEEYLARRARRRVEALRRKDLCRRRHEAATPIDGPTDRRRVEPSMEDRADSLAPHLTSAQQAFLQSVLRRTFSDIADTLSPAALWQIVHRIRDKVREQDAKDAEGADGDKS